MDNPLRPLEGFGESMIAEASRIEEDATYSAKGHFEASRRWDLWHLWIGIPTSVLAAIAGVLALSNYTIASAVLSLIVAAASAVFTFLNPKERAAVHLRAGNSYKALHNDARIFRLIECQRGRTPEQLSSGLANMNERRNALNIESPQIPRNAFLRARKGIESGESSYKIDRLE